MKQITQNAVGISGAVTGSKDGCADASFELTLSTSVAEREVLLELVVVPRNAQQAVRTTLSFSSPDDERFHGFGHQYSAFNLRGKTVPILTTEQGVGRGLQPITAALNEFAHGSGGNCHTTYSATPVFLTSRNFGMIVENREPILFDLCGSTKNVASLTVINGPGSRADSCLRKVLSMGFASSRSPRDGRLTTGRQAPLPKWATGSGAIVGYEGGTDAVRALHAKLKKANVTVAAFWLQDWSGLRQDTFGSRLWWNWELDEVQYAGWDQLLGDQLLEDLAHDGTKMLTYINPFLANKRRRDKKTGFKRESFCRVFLQRPPSWDFS